MAEHRLVDRDGNPITIGDRLAFLNNNDEVETGWLTGVAHLSPIWLYVKPDDGSIIEAIVEGKCCTFLQLKRVNL